MLADLSRADYAALLALARRQTRRGDEAEDLLHDALIAAARGGETRPGIRRAWFAGVLRNLSRMNARGGVRRRDREAEFARHRMQVDAVRPSMPAVDGLTPALRVVALLVLSGHDRAEIRHLLRLSDPVLRRRLADIRKQLAGGEAPADFAALSETLVYGSIRRGLLPVVRVGRAFLASHDPDGHPIAFAIRPSANSRNGP